MAENTVTTASAVGISVDQMGNIIACYLDKNGQRVTLDLTAAIEEIAERKVQEHMVRWHGHNL